MYKAFGFLFLLFCNTVFGQEIQDSTIVHQEVIIYFESDEASLTDDDTSKIRRLLQEATHLSHYTLSVDAHTDEVGSEAYNLLLSEKRKDAVVEYLLSQNVPKDHIASNFHGESQRISFQGNSPGHALNRRVTLQLMIRRQFLYLEGTVVDEETKTGVESQVQLSAPGFKSQTNTDVQGAFRILAPLDSRVTLEVVAKDYFIAAKDLLISEKHTSTKLKIPLPRVEMGKGFNFENILFVGDKSILLPESYPVLEHLKRFMLENDKQCIEIAGHINHPGKPRVELHTRYFQLSVARALEVHDALLESGIDADRMLARGYGNWEMIYPYALDENQMRFNRRVEIIISDCDSTAMIHNDQIPNREEFTLADPFLRHYAEMTFERDLQNFSAKVQKDLRKQVLAMQEKGIELTKYTYREMLIALPGLPPAK